MSRAIKIEWTDDRLCNPLPYGLLDNPVLPGVPIRFLSIADLAQELDIPGCVRPAFGNGYHVVKFKILFAPAFHTLATIATPDFSLNALGNAPSPVRVLGVFAVPAKHDLRLLQ